MNRGKKTHPEEANKINPADLPRFQTAAVSHNNHNGRARYANAIRVFPTALFY